MSCSPDGRNVYAVSDNHGAVLTFDREPMPLPAPAPTPGRRDAGAGAGIRASRRRRPTAVPAAPRITAFTASPRRFRRVLGHAPAAHAVRSRDGEDHAHAARSPAHAAHASRPSRHPLAAAQGRHLAPGRYIVTAIPIDAAGRRGPALAVGLTVTRSR